MRVLGQRHEVSLGTIQSAMTVLERDGLIQRRPNRAARVVRRVSKSVRRHWPKNGALMLLRSGREPLWSDLTRGVLRSARRMGAEPLVVNADRGVDRSVQVIGHLPANVRGLLVQPYDRQPYVAALRKAMDAGVRVVQVERLIDAVNTDSVTHDDYFGAYEATQHLIDLHNRPVHYLGYADSDLSSLRDRQRGWAGAMEAAGFLDWQEYFLDLGTTVKMTHPVQQVGGLVYLQEGCDRALELFNSGRQQRYSIFCVGDWSALGVYRAAEQAKFVVGRDVFAVGFYDYPMCRRLDPPLSSVAVDMQQLGYEAANLLYDQLDDPPRPPVHRVLPVTLKAHRSSLGQAQAAAFVAQAPEEVSQLEG